MPVEVGRLKLMTPPPVAKVAVNRDQRPTLPQDLGEEFGVLWRDAGAEPRVAVVIVERGVAPAGATGRALRKLPPKSHSI